MTPEDTRKALSCIEGLADGTESRARIIKHLRSVLTTTPDEFWMDYFDLLNMDNPVRRDAERLLRSGAVDEHTTIGELPAVLFVEAMEEKFKRERDAK